jgi:hypothetical protein
MASHQPANPPNVPYFPPPPGAGAENLAHEPAILPAAASYTGPDPRIPATTSFDAGAVLPGQTQQPHSMSYSGPDPRVDPFASGGPPPLQHSSTYPGPNSAPLTELPTPEPTSAGLPRPGQQPPLMAADPRFDSTPSLLHIAHTPSFQGPAIPQQPALSQSLATPQESYTGLKSSKTAVESSLREYISLQATKRRYSGNGGSDPEMEQRIRMQHDVVLGDLQTLRRDVSALVKAAENQRWRRWLIGGVV